MRDDFIYNETDVLSMLDDLLADNGSAWWDSFFVERSRPCPFFVDAPDENLVEWLDEGLIPTGHALELGCGNGRNATFLAGKGFSVDAIDFSTEAIAWAVERAEKAAGSRISFQCCSVFDAALTGDSYDLVYDSGLFHHLPPHRRKTYQELIGRVLKPGGRYGLVCFRPEGGSGLTDQQVYEERSLRGGLGYTEDRLRALWDEGSFSVRTLRRMTKTESGAPAFGEDFLWTLLAARSSPEDSSRISVKYP